MSDQVKILVRLACMFAANARYTTVIIGPPRDEWDEMSEQDRSDYLTEVEQDVANRQVEVFSEVIS